MGFYGNITNVAGTQFQFDRIYPNRWTMESKKVEDGIYAGRFVLIEYDSSVDDFDYFRAYADPGRTAFYSDPQGKIRIKYSHSETKNDYVTLNTIVRVRDLGSYQDTYEFFRCVGSETGADGGNAMFERVSESHVSSYISNFNIDYVSYGNQATSWRGYDSTVWQKIYTDEGERYVMVAELNSVVPTFMMSTYSDAPTEAPVAPHFDTTSSSTMYYLHAQPQWGFRVAKANSAAQSDEVTTWHPVSALGKPIGEQSVNAAIYYNKAGFDSKTVSKITDLQDKINISPTGKSGQYYNIHDTNNRTTGASSQIDTQELTINLPSIGNAVSDLWDVLYGGTAVNGSATRNRDIQWDSTYGLRLVNRNEDGYTFTPNNVSTVAGCINSVHDLMGMIIETDETEPLYADPDKIYYRENGFYIRWPEYEWTMLNPDGEVIELEEQYVEIDLIPYEKNKYFYKKGNDYLLENADEFVDEQIYYELGQKDKKTFTVSYYPDLFYKKINNEVDVNYSDYILITSAKYDNSIEHFSLSATQASNTTDWFIYKPGVYYYQSAGSETDDALDDEYLIANETTLNTSRGQYYKGVPNGSTVIQKPDGSLETVVKMDMIPVRLVAFEAGKFFKYDATYERYTCITTNDDISQEEIYYTLTTNLQPKLMYEANKYFYEDDAGNHILDTNSAHTTSREYFYNDFLQSGIIFYKAGRYYYVNPNSIKVIDNNASITSGRQYYEKTNIYVYEDENGIFVPGSIWNINIDVLQGTKLATRKTRWGWRELEGFARNLNTIHGLIIEINNRLMSDDKWTRELDSTQGAINTINDIIEKISELVPTEVMIVDEYGHMHSAEIKGDNWVGVNVDDSYLNPEIQLSHKFTAGTNTTSAIDLNTSGSNTIDLYTPQVDNMGHVIGKNIETVTLPYNFSSLQIYPSGGNSNYVEITADSVTDVLSLSPGDDWISLGANADSDTIQLYHKVAGLTTTEVGMNADASPGFGESFQVINIGYDDKGHISTSGTSKVTLPQVTIQNGDGNVVTGLHINSNAGVISEEKNNIANLALTDYVVPAQVYTTITAEDTLKSALSKIETTLYNFNLNFVELDLDIAGLKAKDNEFTQNFTDLDMQLELMQMKDTNLGNRIIVLENTVNDVENEDGSITTGLSSQVNALQEAVSNVNVSSGNWTPVFNGGGTSTTSVSQGSYVKTGNQVIINFYVEVTGQLGDSSDMIYLSGLPFEPDFSSVQSYSGGGRLRGFLPDVGGATFAGFTIESWNESGIYPVSTYIYDAESDDYITNSGYYIQGNTEGGIMSGTIMYTTT